MEGQWRDTMEGHFYALLRVGESGESGEIGVIRGGAGGALKSGEKA